MKTFHVKMVEAVDHCTRKTAMYATVVKASQEIIVIHKVKKIITFLISREFYQELQNLSSLLHNRYLASGYLSLFANLCTRQTG